jgi:hypothetical protein
VNRALVVVVRVLVVGLALGLFAGCKNRHRGGDLYPPDGSPEWETRFAPFFDDDYTAEPLELEGRAPHDVLDQQRFAARLGYAAIVALVRVDQVWGRGRYQGRKHQYVDVELEEVLLGELPKGTHTEQLLQITGEDELEGDLQGAQMVLFVRWAPGERPPFHHHLMPATEEIVAYIRALVRHATKEGELGGSGRKRKRRARARSQAGESADGAPDEP